MEYINELLLDFLLEEMGLIEPILLDVEAENDTIYYVVTHTVGIHLQTDEFEVKIYELLSFIYRKIKKH